MSLKATNNVETNKYELEIEISAEDFEAAIEKAYLKARKNIACDILRTECVLPCNYFLIAPVCIHSGTFFM